MNLQGLLGLAGIVLVSWLFSEARWRVDWRLVLGGLALQIALAAILLHAPPAQHLLLVLNELFLALDEATRAGTSLVFGFLGGGDLPYPETHPGASFVLAFRALPLVLVVSALSALLFYWRILPALVGLFAALLRKTLGIGGSVGISAAANVFVGMVEAPILIRPYLEKMSRGELFMVMVCGMATIAGTVMVLYASIVEPHLNGALGHLLVASVISAPAALAVAALMVPHQGAATEGDVAIPEQASGSMDAITRGTLQGIQLLANIVAMLIVLVALVAMLNMLLGLLPELTGEPITLQRLFGYLLAPFAWLLGVPWSESVVVGGLLGTKVVLNELIAYLELAALPEGTLSHRAHLVAVYSLCGFANFGSLGIMIGGMGAMAPARRAEIVSLGMKSIVAGSLATCMTGALAGIIGP